MACYFPITGFRSNRLNPSGKRSIVFRRQNGFVDQPVTLPCGQCIGCRIDKSRSWALRCVHESQFHRESSFLTLTYSEDKLPLGGKLVKSDLQKFFKRLRKSMGSFRYYACGEYGDNTARPHFHCIIFGIGFTNDRKKFSQNKRGDVTYTSEALDRIWGNGQCLIGEFNYATAAYTARYVMKKQMGKNAVESDLYSRLDVSTGEVFQVPPEFAVMSRKPGLGSLWYDKFKSDVFPSDFLVHEGKKHVVPQFYSNKLLKEEPELRELIAKKRKLALENDSDNNSDRRFIKFIVKKSKLSQLSRSL